MKAIDRDETAVPSVRVTGGRAATAGRARSEVPSGSRLAAAERRELLLDAALRVFLEKGYAGASTREIASAAGVTEALIYRHFTGKRDLLLALLRERTPAAAVASLEAQPDGATLDVALDALLRRVLETFEQDADILMLLFGQSMVDDEVADVWAEIVKENAAVIAAYLTRLKTAGRIAGDAPEDMAAQLLVSSCLMFFLNTRRLRVPGLVQDRDQFVAASVKLFARALGRTASDERLPHRAKGRPPDKRRVE